MAKEATACETVAAESWKPRAAVEMSPEEGRMIPCRWKCEEFCRCYNAFIAVQYGINVKKTNEYLTSTCKRSMCPYVMKFNRMVSSGEWKLKTFRAHATSCSGVSQFSQNDRNGVSQLSQNDTNGTGGSNSKSALCTPVYTTRQIARCIWDDYIHNPTLTTKHIALLVKSKGIYIRQPGIRHFAAVKRELQQLMQKSRAEDMAAFRGHMHLLRAAGHSVELITYTGKEMKKIRVKAARFIFNQRKKDGFVCNDETFDARCVDLRDVDDNAEYYGGFLFVPSIAEHFCKFGRKTSTADAAHCEGVGPQSYGTTFEVMVYDSNHHVVPILFSHSVGSESEETWSHVFKAVQKIPGFDVEGRVTIVDQEKSIDKVYRDVMKHAKLFLDMLHVKKNMSPHLGSEKASALSLYERAVRAPSEAQASTIMAQYGPNQRAYLDKFPKCEVYRSFSKLRDLILTSQGAESQMSASLRNNIRSVEPQQMLRAVVDVQRTSFLKRRRAAMDFNGPVPPQIEQHLAKLIMRGRQYQSSVSFVDGTDHMEATVTSRLDPTKTRRVVLSSAGTIPSCCAYACNGGGFPCLHGVAVLSEKHGSINLHRYVESRNLTASWKQQYDTVQFNLPSQTDMDNVIIEAAHLVAMKQNLHIPVALPPPRGRPSTNTGTRKRSWYERGPDLPNKRSYNCSLCGLRGHNARICDLRQDFQGPHSGHADP